MEKKYGWYSTKMFHLFGYVKYRDLQGNEMICTCISSSPSDSGAKWNDLICLGEIAPNSFIKSTLDLSKTAQHLEDLLRLGPDKWMEKVDKETMMN